MLQYCYVSVTGSFCCDFEVSCLACNGGTGEGPSIPRLKLLKNKSKYN